MKKGKQALTNLSSDSVSIFYEIIDQRVEWHRRSFGEAAPTLGFTSSSSAIVYRPHCDRYTDGQGQMSAVYFIPDTDDSLPPSTTRRPISRPSSERLPRTVKRNDAAYSQLARSACGN